ncbi:MAG: hypothetical protein HYU67_00900 [Flavobacteriia bacterium]|nr:hypothetical protein [Flavobacteriia bacterium]
MNKILFFFFGFWSLVSIQAQDSIRWSELLPVKGRINEIFPISYSDFYTLRTQGAGMFSNTYISLHSNFKVSSNGKIYAKVENGLGSIEKVEILKGAPFAFISDKRDGEHFLYAQKYSSSCQPEGNPYLVCSYVMPKGWKRQGVYQIFTSKNKEFVCINYEIPGYKDEKQRFGFKIFNADFELVNGGEYELPYPPSKVQISNTYLSNNGAFFFAAKVFKIDESQKTLRQRLMLDKMIVYHPNKEQIDEFELNFGNEKIISELNFSSDNEKIMSFTGLYGDNYQNGVKGVFYFQLDFLNKKILSEGWNEFSKDFIMQGWSEREIQKAEKRLSKGKDQIQLFEYNVKDMQTLSDGSLIGLLEQYYVKVITSSDPRTGSTSVTYYYYFNDIIVYKINPNGSFAWTNKIPKQQISTNDYGYFSSFSYFLNNNTMHIIMNDNIKNYNEEGKFSALDGEEYIANFRKKYYAVAHVELQLNDGNVKREILYTYKDVKSIAVPKLFSVDYSKNELLLYFILGKKEKFGVWSF